jgi:2-polyprenyl-3-methyl-5-hydroxy-6-metoxy-1,4-benzoquinol methylase
VDAEPDNRRKLMRLHRELAPGAANFVGLYSDPGDAKALEGEGLQVAVGDAEGFDLGDTFDVLVAADNLEHLSNPGLFLDSARRHLEPAGLLLISTPNPASFSRFLQNLAYGQLSANTAHTCWFSEQVLDQLARRHGFRLVSRVRIDEMHRYYAASDAWVKGQRLKAFALALLGALNRVLCPLLPQLSETLGLVLAREGEATRSSGATEGGRRGDSEEPLR